MVGFRRWRDSFWLRHFFSKSYLPSGVAPFLCSNGNSGHCHRKSMAFQGPESACKGPRGCSWTQRGKRLAQVNPPPKWSSSPGDFFRSEIITSRVSTLLVRYFSFLFDFCEFLLGRGGDFFPFPKMGPSKGAHYLGGSTSFGSVALFGRGIDLLPNHPLASLS